MSGRGSEITHLPAPPRSVTAREHLLEWIAKGRLRPGMRLPPEPELAAALGVSRATLREALRSLEDEGMVLRGRGTGTFLAHRPRVRNTMDVNFGVTEAIRAAGMRPGYVDAVTRIEAAPPEEAERLELEDGAMVVVVERVRTADGARVVHSVDVLPASLFAERPEVLPTLALGSVYEVMEREMGIVIHHGVAAFAPVRASRTLAEKLATTRGAPLLYLRQVDYDDGGHPVLSSHEHHLADAFEFTLVRRGPGRRFR